MEHAHQPFEIPYSSSSSSPPSRSAPPPPDIGKAPSPVVGKPPTRLHHHPRVPESLGRETPHPPAGNHSPVVQKVARYRRERSPKERERSDHAWAVRLSLASSFRTALTCGLRRGRATLPRPQIRILPHVFLILFISAFQPFRFSAFTSRLPLNLPNGIRAGNHSSLVKFKIFSQGSSPPLLRHRTQPPRRNPPPAFRSRFAD